MTADGEGPRERGAAGARVPEPDGNVPWRKNPWVWGIIACIVFPPCVRPFTRTIVEAPLPTAGPVDVALSTADGRPFDNPALGERIHIGFVVEDGATGCPSMVETMRPLVERMDEQAYAGRGLFAPDAGFGDEIRVLVAVMPAGEGLPQLASLRERCRLESERWVVVGGSRTDVEGFASALEGRAGAPPTFVSHQRTVIIDRARRARGLYGVDELGQDEVYHRSQHVLRDQRIDSRQSTRGL